MKKIWVDVESTGLDSEQDKIVELAVLYEQNNKIQKFHKYIQYPSYPIHYKKTVELTGLTTKKLAKMGESEYFVYNKFIEFLDARVDKYDKSDKIILCGYNVGFDDGFVRKMFERFDNNYYGSYFFSCRIDVLSVVAECLSTKVLPLLENYKLATVANQLNIKLKPHTALDDARAARDIYYCLKKTEE